MRKVSKFFFITKLIFYMFDNPNKLEQVADKKK